MKMFWIILFLWSFNSLGAEHALKCKIERTDGVTLFGECLEIDKIALFRSCADFICQVNPSLTRGLVDKEEGCISQTTSKKDFIKKAKEEHLDKSPKEVPFCLYSN